MINRKTREKNSPEKLYREEKKSVIITLFQPQLAQHRFVSQGRVEICHLYSFLENFIEQQGFVSQERVEICRLRPILVKIRRAGSYDKEE
ncbi:hypothetical protein CEXT_728761 [Caerostris extrusa]|uniref:Uncharacterized protein n=1 Tax=Caerostris extrusa TaxID=172846 RepID=A0AAV4W6Q5_CAEEX|nr:hypothetical protein CEXT_728761 [Caerostris extrusa]